MVHTTSRADTTAMVGHVERVRETAAWRRHTKLARLAIQLGVVKGVEVAEVAAMLCKFQCNNFGVVDDLFTPQGGGCGNFDIILVLFGAFLSSTPPHTCRAPRSTWCLRCSGADWCLQSAVVTVLGL